MGTSTNQRPVPLQSSPPVLALRDWAATVSPITMAEQGLRPRLANTTLTGSLYQRKALAT
jgi:hypothetical protein